MATNASPNDFHWGDAQHVHWGEDGVGYPPDAFLEDPVGWHRQETIDDLRRGGPTATPDRTIRQIRGLTDSGWRLICMTVGLWDEELEAGLRIWDDPEIARLLAQAALDRARTSAR